MNANTEFLEREALASASVAPSATTPSGNWDRFVAATDGQVFANAWLGLLAERIGHVQAAVVLLENAAEKVFAPLAVWPTAMPDMERLGKVIERVLADRRGTVLDAGAGLQRIAYPLIHEERLLAVVALELRGSARDASGAFKEIHWASGWLLNLITSGDKAQAVLTRDRLSSVLDNLAVLLRHEDLQHALFESINSLRAHLGCSRASLGLVKGFQVKLKAVSDAAEFDRHAPMSKAYEEAMADALDLGYALRADSEVDGLAPKSASVRHVQETSGATSVLVYPLKAGVLTVAVLVLERMDRNWNDADLVWLEAFSGLSTPLIDQRVRSEEGVLRRAQRLVKRIFGRIFGPDHLVWKLGSVALLLLALVMAIPVQYRVSARTVIEGEVHRVVSAPFDGFLLEAGVRPGDTVTKNDVMARLDDRDLRMEASKWASEYDQHTNRLLEAMVKHDQPAVAQIESQVAQSKAQLDLVQQKLARSVLRAPFDGVVVSGDLSQQLGASVEVGKRLFEVAPLDSYRVILQVDERDVRFVQLGQPGTIVMTGLAGDPMDFKVNAITPVATAEDGRNFFRVEASLAGDMPRLRPGMEGVGKVQTEKRSLWWVLTHELTDWLRLGLWRWMP